MQTLPCVLDPSRAAALHAALGLPGPPPAPGDALPPFFHAAYFWDVQPPDALGRDGHPQTGGLIPNLGLPRRMWAGGEINFHGPLRTGQPAERRSEVKETLMKQGRSGPLGFVHLEHQIWQGGALRITERQDLVYREDVTEGQVNTAQHLPAPEGASEPLEFSPVLLFRYSALTMNSHRIHYDADYARQVEGYDGPVVHGPLLAQLLMLRAARDGEIERFRFRAV
ncbi:MAG: MaoC family dehydratase N-terminal domain-containing protein, partial [Pseudomonadota bacterium]